MRVAKAFAAALVLLAAVAGTAAAQNEFELGTFHSHVYYDMGTGLMYTPKGGYVSQLAGDVYNNTNPTAPVLGGISSTDLNGIWGDRVVMTGTGVVQEQDFTVFNPSTSAGPLVSSTFAVNYYAGATTTFIGGFTTGVVTFAGLNPGFFSIVTITGIGGLNINLNTTDILVTQRSVTRVGTATRLGVVILDPPTIGSSFAPSMFISNSVNPAGYYNIGANGTPGYRINVSQPVPATPKSWGAVKALYKN